MRVPAPGKLKIDRNRLLRDVRERLAASAPRLLEGRGGPGDPAWALIEQAAWMVEVLSDQLDRYPFAVMQQLVHLLGGQLAPARPALGLVVVEAARSGPLQSAPAHPGRWRFFAPQTEARGPVEFTPIEGLDVHPGGLLGVVEVDQELRRVLRRGAASGLGGLVAWRADAIPSDALSGERIQFQLGQAGVATWRPLLLAAVEAVRARGIAWLHLRVEASAEGIAVEARVDAGAALAAAAPGGTCPGGDVEIPWGTLDNGWSPPVRVATRPGLPRLLQGRSPLTLREGWLLVPDVPSGFPAAELIELVATPMPWSAVDAIWRLLSDTERRLAPLAPQVHRRLPAAATPGHEAGWIQLALQRREGRLLAPGGLRTLARIGLGERLAAPSRLRLGLVTAEGEALPALRAWPVGPDGLESVPIEPERAWTLHSPAPAWASGGRAVHAFDLPLGAQPVSYVLEIPGRVEGLLYQPVLVANLPAVRDGRHLDVTRFVPEAVSLLFEDLATPDVLARVVAGALDEEVRGRLASFPLAHVSVADDLPIQDWSGVSVDASAGRAVLNAPDASGALRALRPGAHLRLDWYRRTDGRRGNVPAGAIQTHEEEPGGLASVARVYNPLPSFGGADRETPEAATERIFAPSSGVPVLPADFERHLRIALGTSCEGWALRCWAYAERSFLRTALWPPPEEAADPAQVALSRALRTAGPEVLLVALGPQDRAPDPAEIVQAGRVVREEIERLAARLPGVRQALVVPLYALTLELPPGEAAPPLPCHDLGRVRGPLRDHEGRTHRLGEAGLLLNAAVVRVVRPRGGGP